MADIYGEFVPGKEFWKRMFTAASQLKRELMASHGMKADEFLDTPEIIENANGSMTVVLFKPTEKPEPKKAPAKKADSK